MQKHRCGTAMAPSVVFLLAAALGALTGGVRAEELLSRELRELQANSILPAVRGQALPVGVSQVLVPQSGTQPGAPAGNIGGTNPPPGECLLRPNSFSFARLRRRADSGRLPLSFVPVWPGMFRRAKIFP